jgi:2-C-methyl-D-erythritol 4-phosphate cytidylyltransferase
MRIQTPQAYRLDFFNTLLEKADAEGKNDFAYADGMCLYYHFPIYFSKSFTANTKITTKPDIALMKAMMKFSDEELMGEKI